jgi:hypothetical protein
VTKTSIRGVCGQAAAQVMGTNNGERDLQNIAAQEGRSAQICEAFLRGGRRL